MESFKENKKGNVELILLAVVAGIVLAVSIAIIFSVLGGIDYTTIDAGLTGTPAANASEHVVDNINTFYTIAPIYLVVLAAVGIISAVMMVMVTKK